MHVQFYLTLLDTYLPDPDDRAAAFAAVENIPSIREKARVLLPVDGLGGEARPTGARADRRRFLLNLICFAACIEGLFFYGAFAYVYWFRAGGCCTVWPPAPTGCSGTRRCTCPSPSTWSTPSARRSPGSSTRSWGSR